MLMSLPKSYEFLFMSLESLESIDPNKLTWEVASPTKFSVMFHQNKSCPFCPYFCNYYATNTSKPTYFTIIMSQSYMSMQLQRFVVAYVTTIKVERNFNHKWVQARYFVHTYQRVFYLKTKKKSFKFLTFI